MKIEKNCVLCGCSFTTYSHPINEQKFCSRLCSQKNQKTSRLSKNNYFYGKKHTDEAKEKIRLSNIGKPAWNKVIPMSKEAKIKLSLKQKGKKMPPRSEEYLKRLSDSKKGDKNPAKRKSVRLKISRTLTGRPQSWNRGDKCNFWRGGTTTESCKIKNSEEYKVFIKNVYLRDDYKCRKCGKRGGRLNVHHIKNFSSHKSLRTQVINGITLCLECHREFHKKYGIKDNTIIQIKEFIKL